MYFGQHLKQSGTTVFLNVRKKLGQILADAIQKCGVIGDHQHLSMGTAGTAKTSFVKVSQCEFQDIPQRVHAPLTAASSICIAFAARISQGCQEGLGNLVTFSIKNDAVLNGVGVASNRSDSAYIMHGIGLT